MKEEFADWIIEQIEGEFRKKQFNSIVCMEVEKNGSDGEKQQNGTCVSVLLQAKPWFMLRVIQELIEKLPVEYMPTLAPLLIKKLGGKVPDIEKKAANLH